MSPAISSEHASQDQVDQPMDSNSSIGEDDDIGIVGGLQPDISRHVEEAIDAVIQRCREPFMGADGTVWNGNPNPNGRQQAVNVMRAAGGLSAFGRRICGETALSNWQLFVTEDMLDTIVECTNDKAVSTGAVFTTTRQELSTFIGVSILIGVYKGRGEPVRAMWSESEGRKCISQFMTRNRFELITKYLRFDLTNSRQTPSLLQWDLCMICGSKTFANHSFHMSTSPLMKHLCRSVVVAASSNICHPNQPSTA